MIETQRRRKQIVAVLATVIFAVSMLAAHFIVPVRDLAAQQDWLESRIMNADAVRVEPGVLTFTSAEAAKNYAMDECFGVEILHAESQNEKSLILEMLAPRSPCTRNPLIYTETHGWTYGNEFNHTGWVKIYITSNGKNQPDVTLGVPLSSVYLSANPVACESLCIVEDHSSGDVLYGKCRGADARFWNMFELKHSLGNLSLPLE